MEINRELRKNSQMKSDESEIFKDHLIINETPKTLERAFELLTELPDDFFEEGRKDTYPAPIKKKISRRKQALYKCAAVIEKDAALNAEMWEWNTTLTDGLNDEP